MVLPAHDASQYLRQISQPISRAPLVSDTEGRDMR
jgi:hypothetical protein